MGAGWVTGLQQLSWGLVFSLPSSLSRLGGGKIKREELDWEVRHRMGPLTAGMRVNVWERRRAGQEHSACYPRVLLWSPVM